MKYEIGNKIHPHVDHDPHVYGSCTFNLNEEYKVDPEVKDNKYKMKFTMKTKDIDGEEESTQLSVRIL